MERLQNNPCKTRPNYKPNIKNLNMIASMSHDPGARCNALMAKRYFTLIVYPQVGADHRAHLQIPILPNISSPPFSFFLFLQYTLRRVERIASSPRSFFQIIYLPRLFQSFIANCCHHGHQGLSPRAIVLTSIRRSRSVHAERYLL